MYSLIRTCGKWLDENEIWKDVKKLFSDDIGCIPEDAMTDITVTIGDIECSKEKMIEKLKADYGQSFGKYIAENYEKDLREYRILSLSMKTLATDLLIENFRHVIQKYKEDVKEDPDTKFLSPIIALWEKSNEEDVKKQPDTKFLSPIISLYPI